MNIPKMDWMTWALIGAVAYAAYVTDMFRRL